MVPNLGPVYYDIESVAMEGGISLTVTVIRFAGKPLEYFYRHLYLPEQGMFRALPDDLKLGTYREQPAAPVELGMVEKGFIKDGITYQ